MKVLADVLVEVALLLVRKLDVEPDARRLPFVCPLVRGFHDAGAAAGDDAEARI
jgi:hypothetical protein